MRLLIVGKLGEQVTVAASIAKSKGAKVTLCQGIDETLKVLRSGNSADLLIVDVKLDIAKLADSLKAEHINVPIVGCGLESDRKLAVDAIKVGAVEYLPLPPDEELIAAVLEAIAREDNNIIGTSKAMQTVMALADQVASSQASILITGESGTGKEVISKYIHAKSSRCNKDMVSVNCAAIPDNLLESELFGHEKGAFTGAVARRIGKFEKANNSTLLLDEISEMDIRLQAKLLRAIQERKIDRVGGTKPVAVDIRIIATSNRDLLEEVKKGNFREDLFFRLNVITIDVPPLRKRREDIAQLAPFFISKYSKMNHMAEKRMAASALKKLEHYEWPGNIRELENTIHRAVLLASDSQITEHDIMITSQSTGEQSPANEQDGSNLVGKTVACVEKELILKTLDHCLGNRTHAANVLGISIRTLRNKLNEYERKSA